MQCIFLYYVGSTLLDHLVDMFVQHPFSIPQGMFQKPVIKKYIYRIFGNEKKVQQDEQDHVDVMHSAVFFWTS